MIALSEPLLDGLEEELVLEVLRSGHLVQGPMVESFEKAVGEMIGVRHAVAVNNGTSALIASLLAHGIGPGDEVVTSPFTFVGTLNAILHVGATPRFVDIGDDFNLDPARLDAAIGRTTRAILPVHLYGYPAEMQQIEAAATTHNLVIIEDAAQALGATCADRPVGTFGTGCFSFYATKNVTTGEGGVITTDSDGVAGAARLLRNQGQRGQYDYELPGFNFRMTELQAALGVAQMSRLHDIVESRRSNAQTLSAGLAGIEGLTTPTELPPRRHVFHQFTLRLSDARLTRDQLLSQLRSRGIHCGVYYPRPVFDYDCFRMNPKVGSPAMPSAERVSNEVLSLPVHPKLGDAELNYIVEAVREALT